MSKVWNWAVLKSFFLEKFKYDIYVGKEEEILNNLSIYNRDSMQELGTETNWKFLSQWPLDHWVECLSVTNDREQYWARPENILSASCQRLTKSNTCVNKMECKYTLPSEIISSMRWAWRSSTLPNCPAWSILVLVHYHTMHFMYKNQ